MNNHTRELAKQAGFLFWGNESWGPGQGHIDWGCDYTDAIERFVELIKQDQQPSMNTAPLTKAVKSWVVPVEEDLKTGDTFLPLPPELLGQIGWKEGDELAWADNQDGSFTISKKKETELVMVDTVLTYRKRYVVEVPKGKTKWALDTVTMDEAKEFSQECLGEQISSYRAITEEEALSVCDKDNEYCIRWTDEMKKKNFFNLIEK